MSFDFKKPLRSFGFRVTLAIVTSMVVLVFLGDIIIYQFTVKTQFEGLRTYLKSIAHTAARTINAEYLTEVPLTKEGVNTQGYQAISQQLRNIKAANPQIKYIYILTKVNSGKVWKFVVDIEDTEANGVIQKGSLPGTPYDANRFSQMVKGFDTPTADLKLEKDEWGTTLSGYAPIRDQLGSPVAVLGVDMDASNIYKMENQVRKRSELLLAIGVLISLLMGFLISHRVVGPINKLIKGIEYINEGNWHHQVRVWGDDEISQLAQAFNKMASGFYESQKKLNSYFYDSVKSLVMLLEARDHYTLGHSEAVAYYAEKMALRMGMDRQVVEHFKRIVLLHDIGKVGVRDSILLKPAGLDDKEWDVIKTHPILGEQILKPMINDPKMLSIVRNHHERFDGKGYPDGLSKEEIPLLVAIVTVADSYDAMTSTRAYRNALSKEQAMEQLIHNRGTQFHPDVVDVFMDILREEENSEPREDRRHK